MRYGVGRESVVDTNISMRVLLQPLLIVSGVSVGDATRSRLRALLMMMLSIVALQIGIFKTRLLQGTPLWSLDHPQVLKISFKSYPSLPPSL